MIEKQSEKSNKQLTFPHVLSIDGNCTLQPRVLNDSLLLATIWLILPHKSHGKTTCQSCLHYRRGTEILSLRLFWFVFVLNMTESPSMTIWKLNPVSTTGTWPLQVFIIVGPWNNLPSNPTVLFVSSVQLAPFSCSQFLDNGLHIANVTGFIFSLSKSVLHKPFPYLFRTLALGANNKSYDLYMRTYNLYI